MSVSNATSRVLQEQGLDREQGVFVVRGWLICRVQGS